ncbi:RDD family protein [Spiroplasma endosymbiont of Cantharis rufa]|uniref:RDD family protein n=1 Tax=Spiroplasma endosymbiont of Cantharis rufa TaxID=3066279 RepID=UPI0030D1A6B3
MTNQNNKKDFSHNLVKPHLGRIFFARLFDIIICSIPTLLLSFLNPIHDLKSLLINIPVSQIVLFFYFVLLPYLCKGNTLGKLIFNLRLKKINNEKIRISEMFLRELYFLYVPLFFLLIIQIIMGVILFTTPKDSDNMILLKIINNIGYTFLAMWFIYIPLTIYLQKDNIASIDLKLKIRAYFLEKIVVVEKKYESINHIHLQKNRPGKIDLEEIKKITGEEDE